MQIQLCWGRAFFPAALFDFSQGEQRSLCEVSQALVTCITLALKRSQGRIQLGRHHCIQVVFTEGEKTH